MIVFEIVTAFAVAETFTVVFTAGWVVVNVNVAVFAPVGTVTDAGTEPVAGLSLTSDTTSPEGPALPVSVRVPVDGLPPTTVIGANAIDFGTAGLIDSVWLRFTPRADRPMFELVAESTPSVVTVKVPVVFPAPTVMVRRTVAADVLLLVRLHLRPPVGAGPVSVTVPTEA